MAFGSELFSGLLRGRPSLPDFEKIDPGTEQRKAIGSNLGMLGADEKLAGGVNRFNQEQLQKFLTSSIPDYQKLKGDVTGVLEKELAGELPLSDKNQLELHDVAKSFGGGFAGSGAMGNLVARDLGTTELGLIETGLSSTERWMSTVNALENPGLFNLSSMFLTPEQVMQQDTGERNAQFQHDWTQNMINWQTSPR